MLNKDQAIALMTENLPDEKLIAWTQYRDVFIFRVEHLFEDEKDWDPFFSVDILTGEIRDFPILIIDVSEISKLKWTEI